MEIKYPQIGICGLSCRLCPRYQTDAASRCLGCKSRKRAAAGCPFITCAIKKKGVEFCWECRDKESCERWQKHRETGKEHDSFKSYQKLEEDINFIKVSGIEAFDEQQRLREALLVRLLNEFNEGRSRSYYCVAATILSVDELRESLAKAAAESASLNLPEKARLMHSILDGLAQEKGYRLSLRK